MATPTTTVTGTTAPGKVAPMKRITTTRSSVAATRNVAATKNVAAMKNVAATRNVPATKNVAATRNVAAAKATTSPAATDVSSTKRSPKSGATKEATAGGADPIARIHAMLEDPATDVFLFGVRMMLGQSKRPALRDDVEAHRARLESIAATDPSTEHRAAASAALATLANPVPVPPPSRAGAVTRLLKKAVGNDWNKRAEAIAALVMHTDPRIAQVVLAAFTDPQRLVRTAAMRAAGRLHIEEALPRLVQQDDPDVGALLAQAEGLAAFGGPQAEAALASEDLFAHVCRKLTRIDGVAAAKTLALLRTPELQRRLAEVVVGLNADDVNGRHDSLRLLVKRRDPDAVAPLIGGVLDAARDEETRAELLWAARALAAATTPTAAATAAITTIVNEMATGLPALESMRAASRHRVGAPAPAWQSAVAAHHEGMAALLFG